MAKQWDDPMEQRIKTKIPEGFLRQEVRKGFTINEVMKRCWTVYIDILEDISDICRKNSLNLFMCYGTLLGAVREHGFIPWDDDVDVGLVGMDYVNFLDILSREYEDKYNILNPYTRTWHSMNFTHITNASAVSFEREHLKKWNGCPFVTGLDIYPYYYIPRNINEEEYILDLLVKIDEVIGMNRQLMALTGEGGIVSDRNALGQAVAMRLVELQRETGYEFNNERPIENQLEILYDQVCRITTEEDADYVARYDEYVKDRTRKFPKEFFEYTVSKPFEYISVPVPIGYDAILNARFGHDYIMPRQESAAHDYPYYAKQFKDERYYHKEVTTEERTEYNSEIKKKNPEKKAVLYHTSMREMLIHSEKVPAKINSVLKYFYENNDKYELWWMPDIFLKNDEMALDEVAPVLMSQYESILKDFIEQGGNICDIGTEVTKIQREMDEYYGDPGIIADEFEKKGKKTTIQDYMREMVEYENDAKNEDINENNQSAETSKGHEERVIPDEWKKIMYRSDGSLKKIVLYVTSLSVLFQYKDKMVEKIKNVINIFKDNEEDIALIWKYEPVPENLTEALGDNTVNSFSKILELFVKEHRGIMIEGECDGIISLVDAVYGDPDAIITDAMKKHIPVMIQNPEVL